ncbi:MULTISPECIES: DNA polymerase Y family protein [unclassified Amycolatopsis]|uniref:DNA polymerase Y family protein n=1 Tax=unclassified Amycolatopsis TaxID=2618356 RepID=UPI002874BB73|nr:MULTISPECIES: DNA polymerase Y family protein [unclassified Amycolatopsis]MDS0132226.1 DNA polymerase Y family protein [Amycolatopsis sp. 505]MDS0141036.1 DNA polymerase Y family protein [Amycolatopsis sp. CM201R]
MTDAPRLLVLWCPDWPVVAAGAAAGSPPTLPAAVFSANRVVACSASARQHGVGRGMRRRDAQSRCPELVVHQHDPDRDARLFEPVAAAVEAQAVGVEVVRPGLVAVPVDGASGYFGGEAALAELLIDEVAARAGVECQVGVADGLFAATLAARRSALVARGRTKEFLAPLSIAELNQPGEDRGELVDLLKRLGLRTLGAFAALAERDVAGRFPKDAIVAHRLARGLSERPPLRRALPPDLAVTETFDEPLHRVDEAAFVAKTLGERFFAGLANHGLACTRLAIVAVTEAGEERVRVWRCAEPLTARATADRVRWQCEGWLTARDRPTAGIVRLRLDPEEVVGGQALQLQLGSVGRDADAAERAGRALVRIQGLLGPDAVVTPLLDGGRGPGERVRLIPWGEPRRPLAEDRPWPGRLPAPSPTVIPPRPVPAEVLDAVGDVVRCTTRGELGYPPSTVAVDGGPPRRVIGSAGPWVVHPVLPGRRGERPLARVQVVLEGDTAEDGDIALLLSATIGENPQWTVEGCYD